MWICLIGITVQGWSNDPKRLIRIDTRKLLLEQVNEHRYPIADLNPELDVEHHKTWYFQEQDLLISQQLSQRCLR